MATLDSIDRRLLAALQAEGRVTNVDLAHRVGLTAPPCLRRVRAFETHVGSLPEVRECHMLNGEIDFILKIVSKDLQSFQEFLTSKLTPAPNVASVKTSLTIRTAKNEPGVPLD